MSNNSIIAIQNEFKTKGVVAIIYDANSYNDFCERLATFTRAGANVGGVHVERLLEAAGKFEYATQNELEVPALKFAIETSGRVAQWFAAPADRKAYDTYRLSVADYLKRRTDATAAVTLSATSYNRIIAAFDELETRSAAGTLLVIPARSLT